MDTNTGFVSNYMHFIARKAFIRNTHISYSKEKPDMENVKTIISKKQSSSINQLKLGKEKNEGDWRFTPQFMKSAISIDSA